MTIASRLFLMTGVVSFTCGLAHAATYSIPMVRNVETKSGVPVMIGGFIDCRDHTPYEGGAFVQHGKITMQRTTVNQCCNPKEPAALYWYVSDPGFKGVDEVNFSVVGGSALIVHITVVEADRIDVNSESPPLPARHRVRAAAASLVLPGEGRAATCPPSRAPDIVPLTPTGPGVFSARVTLGEGPASQTLDMTADTGAAISGVPVGVADALIAANQAVELQKRTVTLFTGDRKTFRVIDIKTVTVGCHVVPHVVAAVINAQVIGLPVLRRIGRFTFDAPHEQLIFNDGASAAQPAGPP
jgi:hypothetical protein